MTTPKKPEPRFSFTYHNLQTETDEEKTIFMSFGLLNTLTGMFETPSQISEVFTQPMVRLSVAVLCLSERDSMGKVTEEFELDDKEVDPDVMLNMLDWVESHVTYFFIQALDRSTASTVRRTKAMKADS